jgi:hypothetical protein
VGSKTLDKPRSVLDKAAQEAVAPEIARPTFDAVTLDEIDMQRIVARPGKSDDPRNKRRKRVRRPGHRRAARSAAEWSRRIDGDGLVNDRQSVEGGLIVGEGEAFARIACTRSLGPVQDPVVERRNRECRDFGTIAIICRQRPATSKPARRPRRRRERSSWVDPSLPAR